MPGSAPSEATPPDRPAFPAGLANAFWFSTFNALSFQMVLGSPMVLYAKTLRASATVLGVIAGMMPLLVILQIPAAQHVNRVGYKRFVLSGWSVRVAFIFLMALVPLTGGFLDAPTRLVLMLTLLFCFNFSRGISSCAWLPWITDLVPPMVRGRYLAMDQACVNLASIGAFVLAAVTLGEAAGPWRFAAVFSFSALNGAVSLLFLRRIPDVTPPTDDYTGKGPVPWREIAAYPPFRKLLWGSVAWSVAYGGMTTFIVAFLRAEGQMSERSILLVMATSFVGGLVSAWLAGARLDRTGSKPVLLASMVTGCVVAIGWWLQAGQLLPVNAARAVALSIVLGLCNALFGPAQVRLAMLIVPRQGRNHFFALFSVVANITLGVAPIAWGLIIDAVGQRRVLAYGLEWNRFSLFFGLDAVAFAIAFLVIRRVDEPQAARVEHLLREILIREPQRLIVRMWSRGTGSY